MADIGADGDEGEAVLDMTARLRLVGGEDAGGPAGRFDRLQGIIEPSLSMSPPISWAIWVYAA